MARPNCFASSPPARLAQSIVPALLQAFTARAGGIEVSLGVATTEEMSALVEERLADVAVGPRLPGLEAEAVMRYRMTLVGHPELRLNGGGLAGMRWLVDPTGTDPLSDVGALLAKYRVPGLAHHGVCERKGGVVCGGRR